MKKFHSKEDCSISRDDERAYLLNEGGDIVFSFSNAWTDEQIFHALACANRAYDVGFDYGSDAKVREIRKALEISNARAANTASCEELGAW